MDREVSHFLRLFWNWVSELVLLGIDAVLVVHLVVLQLQELLLILLFGDGLTSVANLPK